MKTKVLKTIVASACAMSIISGCAGKVENNDTAGDTLKFTVYNMTYSESALETEVQKKWEEKMEEYMGMKLDITWKELSINDYAEKMSVYLAANKYDDVFMITGLGEDAIDRLNDLGSDGKLVNLMDYKEQLVHYPAYLEENYGRQMVEDKDGNIYCFASSGYADGEYADEYGAIAMRFDILKKHNLTPPDTLEGYYELAKKLKELYPESYPINCLSGSMMLDTFCSINHTHPDIYYNGEEYVLGPVADKERYKETLVFLNKLYSEKLLDSEYLVQTDDTMMEKLLSNRSFMAVPFSGSRITSRDMNDNPNTPGSVWGLVERPENLYGEKSWSRVKKPGNTLENHTSIVISSKAKNPELLVKLLDYQYSDEIVELANWGIEGLTYTRNENGEKEFVPELMNAENFSTALSKYGVNSSLSVRSGIQCIPLHQPEGKPAEKRETYSAEKGYYMIENNKIEKLTDGVERDPENIAPPVRFSKEEREEKTNILTPILTYIEENSVKFITGQKSFDEYDAFIEGVSDMGDYERLLNIYNNAMVK